MTVAELRLVDNRAAPHRGVIVAGDLRPHPTDFVGGGDTPCPPVHPIPQGGSPILGFAAQAVVLEGVHRALLVADLDPLPLRLREGDSVVLVEALSCTGWMTCLTTWPLPSHRRAGSSQSIMNARKVATIAQGMEISPSGQTWRGDFST